MSEENFSKLKKIIIEQLGVESDKVVETASFMEDLGADSLDVVELVMAIEEDFELEIEDEDAGNITTVGEALTFINDNKA